MDALSIFVVIVPFVVFALYFLPTIIAKTRHKGNADAILLLNFFLGWTLIGWVVALVWATTKDAEKTTPIPKQSAADEIEKLAALKAQGVLTEAEFQAKKKKVLES